MVNPLRVLKQIAVTILLITGSGLPVLAQQDWYIFIQAENNQPFYARIGEKIYSSSAIGYLVIPQLKDSTYSLAIGFPKNLSREQIYVVPIQRKDRGYQLKRNGSQGWVLYNWQNMQSLLPLPDTDRNAGILHGDQKKNDSFSTLMAAVVNDSSVLYTSVVKADPPKESPPKVDDTKTATAVKEKEDAKVAADTPVAKKEEVAITETKVPVTIDTVVKKEALIEKPAEKTETPKANIIKLTDLSSRTEKWLVYIDATANKADTISLRIAVNNEPVQTEQPKNTTPPKQADTIVAGNNKAKEDTAVVKKDEPEVKKETPVMPAQQEVKKADDSAVKPAPAEKQEKKVTMINSDCQNFAGESDIDKLRIKMMSESDVKNRIAAAQKLYRTVCLTAKQIRALSELFTTDEDRYRFLEASYPRVADTDNFKLLIELLMEETYKTRFRSLVRM
jgi:hypothetical protein